VVVVVRYDSVRKYTLVNTTCKYQTKLLEHLEVIFHPEDGGNMALRNVGVLPQRYAISCRENLELKHHHENLKSRIWKERLKTKS
jgi:hypothetical protein